MQNAWFAGLALLLAACGGGSAPTPATPPPKPPVAPETPSGPDPLSAPLADHVADDKVADMIGPDAAKQLAAIAKVSPKTEKGLIKHQLFFAVSECPNLTLVDVSASPGLLVAKPMKARERTYKKLLMAGARAQQRGVALEVLSTQVSVKDAVAEWNRAVLVEAARLIKAAPPADQKDKSFATDAAKSVGQESPVTFDKTACESGRLGGAAVEVQLVYLEGGKRGKVLVKGGPDGDRFDKDSYPTVYWDKPKGKPFRTLTEIMSVGFFRTCASATIFSTSTIEDGTWRCKDPSGESWDPVNRAIPAWQ